MWSVLIRCTLLAAGLTVATAGHLDSSVHKAIARRMPANETTKLEKRGEFSGRWTFFDVGLYVTPSTRSFFTTAGSDLFFLAVLAGNGVNGMIL